jgi:DNA segregation ATPase FtsK/SpoIIIE-like protein
MHTDRVEIEETAPHPVKIVVDPEPLAPPKSERMARERQKPLFNDMPDSRLPQVDLLDDSQVRQDPVDSETIEFTSRLIEKKLRDFGVEVKVLAAAPGNGGPGPLIAALTGRHANRMRVPMTIVPAGLSAEELERVT